MVRRLPTDFNKASTDKYDCVSSIIQSKYDQDLVQDADAINFVLLHCGYLLTCIRMDQF